MVESLLSKCEPRLSKEAAEILSNKYVSMRAAHRQREIMGSNSIPITVRYCCCFIYDG